MATIRISLDENAFALLVSGRAVKRFVGGHEVEISLQDIGFVTMEMHVSTAAAAASVAEYISGEEPRE